MRTRPTPLHVPACAPYVHAHGGAYRLPSVPAAVVLARILEHYNAAVAVRKNPDASPFEVNNANARMAGCFGALIGALWYHPTQALDTPCEWRRVDLTDPASVEALGDPVAAELQAAGWPLQRMADVFATLGAALVDLTRAPVAEAKERADFSDPPQEPSSG